LVQELHEAGSKATEAYASCSIIPEATEEEEKEEEEVEEKGEEE